MSLKIEKFIRPENWDEKVNAAKELLSAKGFDSERIAKVSKPSEISPNMLPETGTFGKFEVVENTSNPAMNFIQIQVKEGGMISMSGLLRKMGIAPGTKISFKNARNGAIKGKGILAGTENINQSLVDFQNVNKLSEIELALALEGKKFKAVKKPLLSFFPPEYDNNDPDSANNCRTAEQLNALSEAEKLAELTKQSVYQVTLV